MEISNMMDLALQAYHVFYKYKEKFVILQAIGII